MTTKRATATAVICSGGLARGAFEAGALEVLIGAGMEPTYAIGTSAGAINAVGVAAGVRAGRLREAARATVEVWARQADWRHIFDLHPLDLLRGRGLSRSTGIARLLRQHVGAILDGATARNAVQLDMVTTASRGQRVNNYGEAMTTYERPLIFSGGAFDTELGRESIYRAATASAAFPVLFEPVDIPHAGPCIDGGAVDDTPISRAVAAGARRVVLLVPYPAIDPFKGNPSLGSLVTHLADLLIHERLFRDVRQARRVNRVLVQLRALERCHKLTAEQAADVRGLLDWRELEIIEVRPTEPLRGTALDGFFSAKLRREYIDSGRRAAERALSRSREAGA